jgi:hypothetical protein
MKMIRMKKSLLSAIWTLALLPLAGAAEPIPIQTTSLADSQKGVSLELTALVGDRRLPFSAEMKANAPEPGFWRILARAPGSAPAALDLLPLIEPAVVPPPSFVAARRIEVRITDPTGQPLVAALRVEPIPQQDADEPSWVPAPVEAMAGQDGSARLDVAPSVPLLLTVAAPGFVAERLEIAPQNAGEILVRLTPGTVRSLEVKDGEGKPVPDVTVATAAGLRLGMTDKDGRLAVTIPRNEDAGLSLTAPDCRWLRAALRRDSPAVLTLKLEPPRTVKGQVIDRQTRQPIAGAWVWADGLPSCSARADADGRYSVALPGFGEPRVRAAAVRHLPETLAWTPSSTLLALAPVQTRTATGRVVDLQGRPIPGANVLLMLLMPASSPTTLEGIQALRDTTLQATTDSKGQFRLDRIGKGPFELQARARGFLPTRVRQVPIPPGSGTADLGVISLQPGIAIEGRVVDPEGNPVEGASVQATPSSGFSSKDLPADAAAVTGGDGAFSLAGFRDSELLTLRVARRGFSTRTLSRLETPFAQPLTVELTPAARIAGTVLDESGNPVTAAKLILTEDPQKDPKEAAGAARGRFTAAAQVDSAGRFELVDLAPGRFRLSALASGYLPEMRGGLDLKEGIGIEGIDLVLRRGAVIEGRIQAPDGSPAAGARVMVLDQPAETDLGLAGRPETFADNEGHYELGGLSEGDRTVLAEHPGSRPARRQVQIQEGTTRVDLRLGKGFEVAGRVSGPEGPVAGASLRLLPQEAEAGAANPVTSGPDGTFRFPDVGEGRYRIETETTGYASTAEEVRIAGASLTGLEIRLERGGAVEGRILGLAFQDLAQVQVVATSPGRPGQAGRVDYQGRYRIEGLGPGEWKVIATLPSQGRQTGGAVSLDGNRAEGRLDLEFAAGFALSGRVERGGSPVGGALILVESGDGSGGNAVTNPDGRFRVDGLRPGAYALTALDPRSNIRSDQRLEIEGDREILVALPDAPKPAAGQR